MATKEELYILFDPETYRAGKSNALMCQADLLGTLKRLHNLKVLSRRREDLKIKLHKLHVSLLSNINSVQSKMPTSKVPKEIQKPSELKSKPEESFSKHGDIERELKLIQEKLRELNS